MASKRESGGARALRVGIVGMGIRGRMYAAICRQLAGAELVGLCDVSQAARAAGQDEFGVPGFAEVEGMCRQCRPQAVVVATPDPEHVAPAVAAARAGCHLLIEKPLAISLAEARAIADAVERSSVKAMVAFENHWNPVLEAMKQSAGADELGAMVSCHFQLDDRIDVPTAMLSWSGRSSPGWFLMAHTVELAGWIAGQRPVRASAIGHRGVLSARGIDTLDAIHAILEFDGGMVGSFSSCWVLPESLPLVYQFRCEMVGRSGSMRADLTDQMLHKATAGLGPAQAGRYEHPSTIGVTMSGLATSPPARMFADFISALAGGAPLPCPLEDSLVNVAAIAAVHESIEARQPAEVRT